jgi:hypothetical protein
MNTWKIGGRELDFYDDLTGSYAKDKMSKLGSVEITSQTELSELKDDDFALKVVTKLGHSVRKFPVNSVGDTLVSMLYFEKNASKLPDEVKEITASFLKKHADIHNLKTPEIVEKYASDVSNNVFHESSSADFSGTEKCDIAPDFALTTKTGSKLYPINNEENIKTATRFFEENYMLIEEPSYRKEMATNIVKKASELGVAIKEASSIHNYAEADYSPMLSVHMAERREILQNDEENLAIFEALVEKTASLSAPEFASALENFDVMSGISTYWDTQHLADPYKSTFHHVKTASPIANHKGVTITEDQFKSDTFSEKLASSFDDGFVEEFKKSPIEIFNSLPAPEKDIITSLIDGK